MSKLNQQNVLTFMRSLTRRDTMGNSAMAANTVSNAFLIMAWFPPSPSFTPSPIILCVLAKSSWE